MKWISIATVFLLLAGCQEPQNLLDADFGLPLGTGAGNLPEVSTVSPGNRQEVLDDNSELSGIQATVVVNFSDYMDEAGFEGSVIVMNTTTGTAVSGLELSYNPEARKLYIRHREWSGNSAYLLVLTSTGVKNRWGEPLDGNGNGTSEGRPYDDALSTFYAANNSAESCVATVAPKVSGIEPDTVRIQDTMPVITVDFDAEMDTSTLNAANFTLKGESGSSIQLNRVGVGPYSVSFQPGSALRYGNRYFLTVSSAGVKADAPDNTPTHLLTLDGDGDEPESGEPDFGSYFLVDTVSAPTVSASEITRGIAFDFSLKMDTASLTPERVRAFDELGYVPGSLVFRNNSKRVEYYFSRPVQGMLSASVGRDAKSTQGVMLDGEPVPNGIGGEPWDDYWGRP